MAEWIDPVYAEVVEAMRQERADRGDEHDDPPCARGFLLPIEPSR